MGFLWDFFVVPTLFPCYFYDRSMGFLWDSYRISMTFLYMSTIFLWDYYGMSIESKLKSIENKFKLNQIQLNIN